MRPLLRGGSALLIATMMAGAAGLIATGCGSTSPGESSGSTASGSSGSGSGSGSSTGSSGGVSGSSSGSGASGGSSGSGASGGDAGACVFETLVTSLITQPPSTPVTCGTPLCGCTDNGKLITSVPGSF
jgi:hypothetical protein